MEKEIKFSICGGSEGHPIYKAVDVRTSIDYLKKAKLIKEQDNEL